jgi:hypothetical protein
MMGDIKKMYPQVCAGKTASTQHTLWSEEEKDPISKYQLGTVTLGPTPSTFMATRAFKKTSKFMADLNRKYWIEKCF